MLGGIRSGKSHWAETAIADATTNGGPVRYLATGRSPDGDREWADRVAGHRDRRPPHWSTVEAADLPTQLRSEPGTAALVDDVGGWLAAVMDRRDAWTDGSVAADLDDLVDAVTTFTAPLAVVSPEVGLTVVPATRSGRRFADELGTLNQRLAAACDHAVLVVAGLPVTLKERR